MIESDEIKDLLQNETVFDGQKDSLPEEEKAAIIKLITHPLEAVGNALGKVISDTCEISDINVEIVKGNLVKETLDEEHYFFKDIVFNGNLEKTTTFVLDIPTIKKVVSGILEELPADESVLSDEEKSVWLEAEEQMAISFAKGVSKEFDIDCEATMDKEKDSIISQKDNIIQVSFTIKASDKIDTTMYCLISNEIIKEIIEKIRVKKNSEPKNESTKAEDILEERDATVQPVRFEEFKDSVAIAGKENISLLMDLQLQVSVELGKVKKPIKEILQFTEGTIVELDRLAGENVDLLVSGKVIAKGEVVVVDQNFGVRITQIVTPDKRV